MKIKTPTELHPKLAALQSRHNDLNIERNAKVLEARVVRARLQTAPDEGNAANNRVRALLNEPALPDAQPDMARLETLLAELNDLNKAIAILHSTIQKERDIASRLVCDSVRPEVTKLGKAFGNAVVALHTAHSNYLQFLDDVENTGANTSSLGPIWPTALGGYRDPSGAYRYMLEDFVSAGYLSKSDVPEAFR